MSRFLKLAAVLSCCAGGVGAQTLDLGRAATPDEIAAWDIDVRPDGTGLPAGRGNVADGEAIFGEVCASCHGDFAEGVGRWPVLSGGHGSLTNARPVKTVGSYWPYLSTVYDYVNRAMPFGNARSLSADEVYAITAYLLYANDLVEEDFELSQENFAAVELPNEEGFFMDDRAEVELPLFSEAPCMSDCKTAVEVTARAAKIDVTPEDAASLEGGEPEGALASGTPDAETASKAEPETTAAPEPEKPTEAAESQALDPELVADGEKAFRKCKACHEVGEGAKNKTGPHLNDVHGRVLGGIDGFKYSKAMSEMGAEGTVWNDETLAAFLEKPRDFVKGTKMSFSGFKKQSDIDGMIAYLKSLSQ